MSLTKQDLTDIRYVILEALDVAVNPRLDTLDGQMDRVEGRMGKLEGRMDGLENHMGSLENRMVSLEGRVSTVDSGQRETNRRLAAIETK